MRLLHHLYADLFGYFWINCKRCGKGFGGHQWKSSLLFAMQTRKSKDQGTCVYCPSCAKTRNEWEPGWYDKELRNYSGYEYVGHMPDPEL